MPQEAVEVARVALIEALIIALPILGVGLVVGLLVSLFQAVTQIQEQTLSFVPKMIVTALAAIALLGWIAARLIEFATEMFGSY
jgi:flagellar biosynthetic protein FliQ